MNLENWIILYVFFELSLIKDLGYDTNLEKFKNIDTSYEVVKITIDSFSYGKIFNI